MRAALSIAALAAGALAIPYNKRAMVVDYDVVYVTDVVTVTAGQQPAATPAAYAKPQHYGHGHGGHQSHTTVVESSSAAAPAYEAPAPTSTSEAAPVYQAPAPSSSTPAYSAPAPVYSAPSSSAPAAAPSGYSEIVVAHHNLHRQNHSVSDVQWDEGLASCAATIAASCVYAHNTEVDGGGYGQNIAAGVAAENISAVITDLFYNGEEPYYAPNYNNPNTDMSGFEKWGHFTQIVWKGTTAVGCATQYCPGGLGNVGSDVQPYFTVCNYKNPGNYEGEYNDNVLPPKQMATANWNTYM